jgi:ABC-2 type transport system permease protein
MKKTLLVTLNEIRATLSRKAYTILALGLPLVLGLAALVVMMLNKDAGSDLIESAERAREDTVQEVEGYVDEGGLIRALPGNIPADALRAFPDEAAAQAALETEEIAGFYIIPADYLETGDIIYVQMEYSPLSGSAKTDLIEFVLAFNLLNGDTSLAAKVRNPLTVKVTQLESPASQPESESWITELFPNLMAFSLYMVIIIPSGVLVTAVVDEKKNYVIEVLMSSVSPGQLIGGKILALGLLGLLQTVLWIGILWGVVRFGGQPLSIPAGFSVSTALLVWAFVFGLLGYAMYGALMAGLGALAPDIKDTRGASFVILSPLIIVYMFLVAITARPEGPVAMVMSFFPLTGPVAMIARMAVTDVPLWQSLIAALLQLLTAIFIVRTVARLFRAQTLLSGQPFSFRQFANALLDRA